jgi:predicted ABC-class ATPase
MKQKKASVRSPKSTNNSRRLVVVIDHNAKLSPYAKYATIVFRRGVQRAYQDLARKKIYTVVLKDGRVIRGIPRQVDGKFVVIAAKKASKRVARTPR